MLEKPEYQILRLPQNDCGFVVQAAQQAMTRNPNVLQVPAVQRAAGTESSAPHEGGGTAGNKVKCLLECFSLREG